MWKRAPTRRDLLRWSLGGLGCGVAGHLATDRIVRQAVGQPTAVSTQTADASGLSASPDRAWTAVLGEKAGFPYAVTQADDGSFVVLGRSLDGGAEIVAAKTKPSPDRSLDWTQRFSPESATLNTILYSNAFAATTADEGYVCCAPAADFFLVKLNASGETVWQRSYPNLTSDADFSYIYGGKPQIIGTGMVPANDGGYLLTGLGGVLLKTDADGTQSWAKTLTPEIGGTQAPLIPISAVQTADGGYAIGQTGPLAEVPAGESRSYWPGIVTVGDRGEVQWRRQYREPLRQETAIESVTSALPSAIVQTSDGGFVLTGLVGGSDRQRETFTLKTDPTGRVAWTQTRALTDPGRGAFAALGWTDGLSLSDGGTVLVGTTSEVTTTFRKVTASGSEEWSTTIENTHGTTMTRTTDDGIVITGFTTSEEAAGAGLLKFGGGPRFRPEVHGFGFENWATGLEILDIEIPERFDGDANKFPSHSHEKVTREEIQAVVDDEWKTQLEERYDVDIDGLSEAALDQLATYVYTAVNEGSATGGHCWGMTFTAQHYFENPDAIPLDYETASDISKPTVPDNESAEPVGDDIDRRQTTLYLNLDAQLAVAALEGSDPIDYDYQLARIREAIAQRGTAPLCLRVKTGGKHQVLAYDIEKQDTAESTEQTPDGSNNVSGETVSVWVYNPYRRASLYDPSTQTGQSIRADQRLVFNTSGDRTTLEKTPPVNTPLYDRAVYIGIDQETDLEGMVRAGSVQTTELLVRKLFKRAFFATQSPVTMRVTGPNGEELPSLVSPYDNREVDPNYNPAGTEYEQIHYVWEAPAGEYTIELTGEEAGEYTLRAVGATVDGGHIDATVTDTIEKNEVQEFTATIPSDGDATGSLSRDVSDTSGATATSGTDTTETARSPEGGGNTGLIAGGAVSGLGVGGYLLYRRLRNTDSEEGD